MERSGKQDVPKGLWIPIEWKLRSSALGPRIMGGGRQLHRILQIIVEETRGSTSSLLSIISVGSGVSTIYIITEESENYDKLRGEEFKCLQMIEEEVIRMIKSCDIQIKCKLND